MKPATLIVLSAVALIVSCATIPRGNFHQFVAGLDKDAVIQKVGIAPTTRLVDGKCEVLVWNTGYDQRFVMLKNGVCQSLYPETRQASDKHDPFGLKRQKEFDEELIRKREHRKQFVESNPFLDESVKKAIVNEQIQIGMTKDAVQASWGSPSRKSRHVGGFGVSEIWSYEYPRRSLHFSNGLLTSFSEYNR